MPSPSGSPSAASLAVAEAESRPKRCSQMSGSASPSVSPGDATFVNVAVRTRPAVNVRSHVVVRHVAPLQPANVEPTPAVATSESDVPAGTATLHVVPHVMPPPDTVPVPDPLLCTVSV